MLKWLTPFIALGALTAAAAGASAGQGNDTVRPVAEAAPATTLAVATFAGGCFWCMEARFESVPGVKSVEPGYTGGATQKPTYDAIGTGKTGHVEAIEVRYDPRVITFEGLLQVYFRMADPTDLGGQFVDRGTEYRPVIFYHDEQQKAAAEKAIAELRSANRYRKPVVVPVQPAARFWLAEEEHRDFYKKNDVRFRAFRYTNPRGVFQQRVWGADLKLDYSRYQPASDESF